MVPSPPVSVVVVALGAEPAALAAALESTAGQEPAPELIVCGDAAALPAGWGERVAAVEAGPPGATPAAARNAALARGRGRYRVLVEGHERLAPGALARHLETLEADPTLVASYGRTAVHDAGRVRLRPESGRGGHLLGRIMKDKHLISSAACMCWRASALEAPPLEEYVSRSALRVALAIHLARRGPLAFHPLTVAEREAEDLDLPALEEQVRLALGVLYGPEHLEEKLEQRARFRLARNLVAIGKQHYRQGDHRLAGKFFDEAVKAAPGYFKGRRYQFLNFVRNTISRPAR